MSDSTGRDSIPNVPPELAEFVGILAAYWNFNATEQAALVARGVESLPWPDLLRLHHLNCLEALQTEQVRQQLETDAIIGAGIGQPSEALERCRQTGNRLLSADSPYRPRHAAVWRGAFDPNRPEPTTQGELCNPSLTHLGCLEVLRLDEYQQPRELAFVAYDDLRSIAMATPRLFRAARLSFDDGRPDEIVSLPLLYVTSWRSNDPHLREGRATLFLNYPPGDGPATKFGIGVGQQDFSILKDEGRNLFGLGSVTQIIFALNVADPRFELKCRARGLDPDEVLRRVAPKES